MISILYSPVFNMYYKGILIHIWRTIGIDYNQNNKEKFKNFV